MSGSTAQPIWVNGGVSLWWEVTLEFLAWAGSVYWVAQIHRPYTPV